MPIPEPRKAELDSIFEDWTYLMGLLVSRCQKVNVDTLAREASALVMSVRKDEREAGRWRKPATRRKSA